MTAHARDWMDFADKLWGRKNLRNQKNQHPQIHQHKHKFFLAESLTPISRINKNQSQKFLDSMGIF
jgi:hypothetical protein